LLPPWLKLLGNSALGVTLSRSDGKTYELWPCSESKVVSAGIKNMKATYNFSRPMDKKVKEVRQKKPIF